MRHAATKLRAAALLCALSIAALAQVHAAITDAVVGEATLVIGRAHIVTVDGRQLPMERGAVIRVGDTIQTEAGGHVHLRFVDGGRVSVRPSSRLQVENYAYSAQQPQLSAIKFKLEEGVVRSITGAWGEAARQRFRLNTPLAAIGVKGTDFIVRATVDSTAATVFTGAITVAPLQGACISTLGPCLTGLEKMLSEDMRGQMIELARFQTAPSLVPASELTGSFLPHATAAASQRPHKAPAGETTVLAAVTEKPLLSETRVASVVHTLGSEAGGQPATLSWARYPWAHQLAGDNFSQRFETAMLQGYERLGGNGAYALLRQVGDPAAAAINVPAAGLASFQLAASAATVVRDEGRLLESARIDHGTLNIDFGRSTFDTQLLVTGPWLGADTVHAAGRISNAGVMQATAGNANLQGGISTHGREAGFAFQKGVPAGVLQGITLWGR